MNRLEKEEIVDQEVLEYTQYLGMNLQEDTAYLYIA